MLVRPRRLRQNSAIRDLCQETFLSANDFIYPIFVKEGKKIKEEISSMPGIYRWSIDTLLSEIEELCKLGIKAIAIFPVIEADKKTLDAKEAFNPKGLTQRAVKEIKTRFPDLLIATDVALDPYTLHGHDGLLIDGRIDNDKTVEVLIDMAIAQANAGSDIIAPSDMMDGRVGAIRSNLELAGHQDTMIMSYTAKYASCLYGPFRDALGSLGSADKKDQNLDGVKIPKDKKTYQMSPANAKEALQELSLDLSEGADIVMVKPASWYLDVIQAYSSTCNRPVAAYQVSGEFSMIHAAAKAGYINIEEAIAESLIAIKRAGADFILSYFAKTVLTKTLK